VGGGDVHSFTLGMNYSFNKYVQVMVDYTFHRLNKDMYPQDKNFHMGQARVQFTF
jgi:phosphate-selective porin OprO/OprP